jgi:acetolactate synthase-1/2/3 large subunit
MTARSGGALTVEALRAGGIDYLFGLPGGHILSIFDAARRAGLPLIDTRHEENAVLMAGGFGLAAGRPAAAVVTAGPGLTNALPGIAEINASGIPAVVLAGRTSLPLQGRGAVQDVDQRAVVTPVTTWQGTCLRTEQIPEMVATAIHRSRSGAPGVAYLEIPQDVLDGETETEAPAWEKGYGPPARSRPSDADLERAIAVLSAAERPAVLAGSGAFFSGAATALARFAERTGIPVITTAAARGLLPDDHPMCTGSLVHGGVTLVSADASLVLGSAFNANIVYGGPPLFGPDQAVVQVDVRPEHLGGSRRPDVALAGDVSATLDALSEAWELPPEHFAAWLEDATSAARASREGWQAEADGPARGIHPGRLARELAGFADEVGDHTFVSDGGDSVVWGLSMSRARGPGTNLFIGSAMGTLGVGTPFAVGARAANPERPAFLFTGDGAFGMSALELDTAQRYGLPILAVVVNNGGWGDTRAESAASFGEAESAGRVSGMHYGLLGRAVGGHGERIEEPGEIRPALQRAWEAVCGGRVAVIDAVCDPEAQSSFMANVKGLRLM